MARRKASAADVDLMDEFDDLADMETETDLSVFEGESSLLEKRGQLPPISLRLPTQRLLNPPSRSIPTTSIGQLPPVTSPQHPRDASHCLDSNRAACGFPGEHFRKRGFRIRAS